MRLIDADALKRRVQKVAKEAWEMSLNTKIETTLIQFIDFINEAPSVEPEIIRCKDCKHCWRSGKMQINGRKKGIYSCNYWDAPIKLNGYCDNAERRTDETD